MLEVKNLSVSIHGKPILDGLDLTAKAGEVAAIMGPNGSGKSTLSYVIAGKPEYEVTGGDVLLDGESLLELEPNERAAKGVFLAFQYPVEIPGVATMTFLKAALNAQRRARGEERSHDPRLHARGARRGEEPQDRSRHAEAPGQRRLFRRREEARRNVADGAARPAPGDPRRDRLRARHRRAADRRRGRQRAARPQPRLSSSSRITSACSTTSNPTSSMSWPGGGS